MTLEDFFARRFPANGWFKVGPYEIFLRHARHMIDGEPVSCLDLANIVNTSEEAKGKGGFGVVVELLEKLAIDKTDHEALYVENVQNPGLAKHLEEKLNFYRVSNHGTRHLFSEVSPTFYRRLKVLDLADMNEMDAKQPGWDVSAEDLLERIKRL